MPELPEVEAARRAVHDHCIGKRIRRAVVADDPKVIDGISSGNLEAALVGKTIVSAKRKGKNMWLELNSPPSPSFQFGMAGAVYIKGVSVTKYKRSAVKDTDEWPSKYSKVFIELDDGLELSFTDKRRFARVRLLDYPALAPPISELGPDALLEPMTIDEFSEALSKKKIAIKTLLLDQSFVAGIGNWIADEVLYQARIHPLEVASSLSKEKCTALLNSVKEGRRLILSLLVAGRQPMYLNYRSSVGPEWQKLLIARAGKLQRGRRVKMMTVTMLLSLLMIRRRNPLAMEKPRNHRSLKAMFESRQRIGASMRVMEVMESTAMVTKKLMKMKGVKIERPKKLLRKLQEELERLEKAGNQRSKASSADEPWK